MTYADWTKLDKLCPIGPDLTYCANMCSTTLLPLQSSRGVKNPFSLVGVSDI